MSIVKIEKDTPIPMRKVLYRKLEKLKADDVSSLFIQCPTDNESLNRIRCRIRYYSNKIGFKFCSEKEMNGLRIWRIE